MTVTIELKPEIEAHYLAQAAAQNTSVAGYIQTILESLAITQEESAYDTMTPAERSAAWEEWLNSHEDISGPQFLDDSRESIYREREDSQL